VRLALPVILLLFVIPGCIQPAAHGPCLRLSLYPESVTIHPGNATRIEVSAQNCGDVALTLGGERCDAGNGIGITFAAEGSAYRLGNTGGAILANRTDAHVCPAEAPPARVLQPGERVSVALGWNGTLMGATCFREDCAERYHDAPPGSYALAARAAPREGGPAQASGLARIEPR